MNVILIILAVAAVTVGAALWWRRQTERHSLPCPTWLGWSLWLMENPVTGNYTGTQETLRRLEVRPGQRVLDIGCGPGRVTLPAARLVGVEGEVLALDVQQNMLEWLRERAGQSGLDNVRTVQSDINEADIEAGTVDAAWMITVLGEIPSREAAMQKIAKWLKPGGRLSVGEVILDPHYQRFSTVQKLANEAGLTFKAREGSWFSYAAVFEKPTQENREIPG